MVSRRRHRARRVPPPLGAKTRTLARIATAVLRTRSHWCISQYTGQVDLDAFAVRVIRLEGFVGREHSRRGDPSRLSGPCLVHCECLRHEHRRGTAVRGNGRLQKPAPNAITDLSSLECAGQEMNGAHLSARSVDALHSAFAARTRRLPAARRMLGCLVQGSFRRTLVKWGCVLRPDAWRALATSDRGHEAQQHGPAHHGQASVASLAGRRHRGDSAATTRGFGTCSRLLSHLRSGQVEASRQAARAQRRRDDCRGPGWLWRDLTVARCFA